MSIIFLSKDQIFNIISYMFNTISFYKRHYCHKKGNCKDEDKVNDKNERGRVVTVHAIRKDTSPAINTRKL